MPKKRGTPAKLQPNFRVVAFFAGRPGSQMEYSPKKRESIRQLRRLLGQAPLGSTGAVKMIVGEKETLIYQAYVALRPGGSTYVKVEEL